MSGGLVSPASGSPYGDGARMRRTLHAQVDSAELCNVPAALVNPLALSRCSRNGEGDVNYWFVDAGLLEVGEVDLPR